MTASPKPSDIQPGKFPRPVAGVFIFNDEGKLFLCQSPKWNNRYICPGGKIDFGEKMADAAKREVKEETNIDIADIELLGVSEATDLKGAYAGRDKHLLFLDFKARAVNDADIKLNSEAVKYKWLFPEEWLAKDNVEKFTRLVIEEYLVNGGGWEEKYKRALADYQNLLKRTAGEKEEFVKFANERLLLEILPVYDNLKMAVEHGGGKNHDALLEGVKHVAKQFKDILTGVGVAEIKTKGEKFDHDTMDAVAGTGEKVKKEVRPGYKLNGKVIIPARVILE